MYEKFYVHLFTNLYVLEELLSIRMLDSPFYNFSSSSSEHAPKLWYRQDIFTLLKPLQPFYNSFQKKNSEYQITTENGLEDLWSGYE